VTNVTCLATNCGELIILDLYHCKGLTDVNGLAASNSLERIDLGQCDVEIDASVLATCPKLEHLNLRGCTRAEGLSKVPDHVIVMT